MRIYSFFIKPGLEVEQNLICLAERFDWFAFLLPPLWATANGLWREFGAMLAVFALFIGAGNFFVLPALPLYFLFALWLGLAAGSIRMRALERKGWQRQSDLIAAGQLMAESLFWRQQQHSLDGKQQ